MYGKECIGTVGLVLVCIVIRRMVKKEYYRKEELKEKLIFFFGIVLCVVMASYLGFWTKDVIMDFPILISGDLECVSGTILTNDTSGGSSEKTERSIRILDEEANNIIECRVYDYYIYSGEQVEVYYLPNTHIGVIVR